jgi:hypothetical protein
MMGDNREKQNRELGEEEEEEEEEIYWARVHGASRKLQRWWRGLRARKLLRVIVRANFIKRLDAEENVVYINKRTGERFTSKPLFLGSEDLELDTHGSVVQASNHSLCYSLLTISLLIERERERAVVVASKTRTFADSPAAPRL